MGTRVVLRAVFCPEGVHQLPWIHRAFWCLCTFGKAANDVSARPSDSGCRRRSSSLSRLEEFVQQGRPDPEQTEWAAGGTGWVTEATPDLGSKRVLPSHSHL